MSWTELNPIVRTAPRVRASVQVTKQGAKLTLTLSDTFLKEVGEPGKCDVQAGSGENAGKLRISFNKAGKFTIIELKHCGRLTVPAFDGIPESEREPEACKVEASSKADAIISLPIAAWEKQSGYQQPAKPVERKPDAPQPSQNGHDANGSKKKLDICAYLQGKGHKAAKRSDGAYSIDGNATSKARAVLIINEYRARAQLAPIAADDAA